MNIQLKQIEEVKLQGIISFVYEDQESQCSTIKSLKETKTFEGKHGEVFYYTKEDNGFKYCILVGLGKADDLTKQKIAEAMAKGTKEAKKLKLTNYGVRFFDADQVCPGGRIRGLVEGLRLAHYDFTKYKSDAKTYNPEVSILGIPEDKKEKVEKKFEEINNIIDGIIQARNLVNEPANEMYPEVLANSVVEIGKESGFEVEVFDEVQIQEMGMKAFWEVAKGSAKKPRFIVMRYMGNPESKEIMGLVGKGLTYDTGGYSLKPTPSMDSMKSDMGGAAAVIGTMQALAKNKVKENVVAVVAACENAISGDSYKPGDVIGSMAGKTIEVLNTDAEGRLTLVDAVHYIIEKENATKVVDVATLTGAVLVALGTTITGVISNNDAFYTELETAAKKTGEKFWRLPNDESYKKLIKGEVADLRNIGGRHAGTITAGMFIEEFVQGKPWLHLDIAGTGWADTASALQAKGGTGAPVHTLYELVVKKVCQHK